MALTLLDLNYGNKLSLSQSFERNQIPYRWATEPPSEAEVTAYLIPGVGSAANATNALMKSGWKDRLLETKKPIIGICLGYQMLFEWLEEDEFCRGLGFFKGVVKSLDDLDSSGDEPAKGARVIPHLGWNRVEFVGAKFEPFSDLDGEFYFAHSYAPLESANALTQTDGFVSSAFRDHVLGFQFHPELSGTAGDELLRRTWLWCKSFPPSTY
jgi:imidazole glycerol-phosphate synthase subunit HisH